MSLSHIKRPSGRRIDPSVLPAGVMSHLRPRSSTRVSIPACASRSPATGPPKPLPTTMALTVREPPPQGGAHGERAAAHGRRLEERPAGKRLRCRSVALFRVLLPSMSGTVHKESGHQIEREHHRVRPREDWQGRRAATGRRVTDRLDTSRQGCHAGGSWGSSTITCAKRAQSARRGGSARDPPEPGGLFRPRSRVRARVDEIPWQLARGGAWEKLSGLLSAPCLPIRRGEPYFPLSRSSS